MPLVLRVHNVMFNDAWARAAMAYTTSNRLIAYRVSRYLRRHETVSLSSLQFQVSHAPHYTNQKRSIFGHRTIVILLCLQCWLLLITFWIFCTCRGT